MHIEKWIVAHFSPTGGTRKVADAIAAGFETPVAELDLCRADASALLGKQDGLMAVLPVFGGHVPLIALERLSALKASGQKAVAVVVYGNREFDDALLETKHALEAAGFQVVAAAAFIAEHSLVRSIAAGRPDARDKALCRQFAADVMAKPDHAPSVNVPGNYPYAERKSSPFHPEADERCIRCGICAEQCPTNAISASDPKKANPDLCINCLRCAACCPRDCRALPAPFVAKATEMLNENAAGYKQPVVFL